MMHKYRGIIFLERKNSFIREIVYKSRFYSYADYDKIFELLQKKHKYFTERNPYVVYSWALEINNTETNLQQYQIDTTCPTNHDWLSDQPWEIKGKRNG